MTSDVSNSVYEAKQLAKLESDDPTASTRLQRKKLDGCDHAHAIDTVIKLPVVCCLASRTNLTMKFLCAIVLTAATASAFVPATFGVRCT
jgi:hypothetical protein